MTQLSKVFGDGSRCIDHGGGVAMHWFPTGRAGERCHCGEVVNDIEIETRSRKGKRATMSSARDPKNRSKKTCACGGHSKGRKPRKKR